MMMHRQCEFDDLLTTEQKEIRDRVRAFCDDKVLPVINAHWERAAFPTELIKELGALGIREGVI
jgi:glutaryl-CoA dehydrogenase